MPPGPNGGSWKPRLNWEFNLGHVGMIITLLVSLGMMYEKLISRMDLIDARMQARAAVVDIRLSRVENDVRDLEFEVREQ